MILPEFEKFPKIPRFNRDIIITEKIDGTNAQLYITEDGRIISGSRNRWLTIEKDNFGFAAWVEEHAEELFRLGPGRHYGEWWGQGIQRGYGLDRRRFSLFNVSRWQSDENSSHRLTKYVKGAAVEIERTYPPACCHVIPILQIGPMNEWTISGALDSVRIEGSYAAPNFLKPEGIVIYHIAGNCLFKITLENDARPKEKS